MSRYGGAAADMGAMVVTGVPGNPIAALARQTHSRMHHITAKCRIYLPNGQPAPEVRTRARARTSGGQRGERHSPGGGSGRACAGAAR
eukprot:6329759-Prymnesium_polylepis.1